MMQQRLIWFAIVFSTLLYGIAAYATQRNFHLQPIALLLRRPLFIIVYVIAIAIFFAVSAIGNFRFIARLALFDAVALLGLVAAILMRDWRVYLPLWALALVGFMRTFPAEMEASSWKK